MSRHDARSEGGLGVPARTLAELLAEIDHPARSTVDADVLDRAFSGVTLWVPGDQPPGASAALVVCLGASTLDDLTPLWRRRRPLVVATRAPRGAAPALLNVNRHLVVTIADNRTLTRLVAWAGRESTPSDISTAGRLAVLTESLSDVLYAASPADALVNRLARITRSTVGLLDRQERPLQSSGPLPLTILQPALARAEGATVDITSLGWFVTAYRLSAIGGDDSPDAPSWLVATSRADSPTAFERAALRLGASLVLAITRGAVAETQQRRAVRASALHAALELRPQRRDPELSARIAALGIDLDDESHVMTIALVRQRHAQPTDTIASIHDDVTATLRGAGIPELSAERNDHLVVLAQASEAALRRLLVSTRLTERVHVGIGRAATSVDLVADSYHDANLGVRLVQHRRDRGPIASYEDFDVATRLFADIGLDRMASWANAFLAPLAQRPQLLDGITAYFGEGQSVKAAAGMLGIHHNSMRYRLAKVEELLGVKLTDPAAIASIYLALTATALTGEQAVDSLRPVRRRSDTRIHDANPPEAATAFQPPDATDFGASFRPAR